MQFIIVVIVKVTHPSYKSLMGGLFFLVIVKCMVGRDFGAGPSFMRGKYYKSLFWGFCKTWMLVFLLVWFLCKFMNAIEL